MINNEAAQTSLFPLYILSKYIFLSMLHLWGDDGAWTYTLVYVMLEEW